ncbi:MAG TPA: LUD domain-containing protein [Anaerolineales bacterium]|nr:LUD domain-containing protein [Anaerolineales bacterium]
MNNAEFRERIRRSLANETLQIALDGNAKRRVDGRIAAFTSLPDWRARRQQAHAVRADVIEHLEEYLQEFIGKAEQNGIIVHRAKDAAEAVKLISGIVKDLPQKAPFGNAQGKLRNTKEPLVPLSDLRGKEILVAKSKSMVSEEINLNHALEAQGIRVVETDLGEFIVQLRNEKPAHIITPAVHLRRDDVGRLFHEKLGIPYTEDIPTLTNTARKVLREVFLSADVGFSGVNFGVAETGTLCIVTNEGNGRMVTTLPPVHIALMGMERLVRDLDDLALMLSLLPRSATAQKLSVYTQLIHAPFPGQQRHLILLDNGRTGLRNSPLKESLYCIRCGACLNACPVFREIGGHAYGSTYSGPIGSVISAGFGGSDFIPLAQASSLCGACKEACPVDIDLPKLLTRVRAGQIPVVSKQSPGSGHGLSTLGNLFMKVYSLVARHPRLFTISQKVAALGTHLVSPFSEYVPLPAFTGWGYSKDLPRFAGKTFRERFVELEKDTDRQVEVERYTSTPAGNASMESPAAPVSLVASFTEELKKVGGNVLRTDPQDLTDKILDLLQARGIQQIHLEPNVLDEPLLEKAGITISHTPDAALPVGVTKAICGLADTGSILVVDGEGNPLQASLLPQIHIAVLCASDILPSLADAMKLPVLRQSKAAVVITGPSRTADIEMSLTIGVHGPGEVQVFLVHSAASTLVHRTASTLVHRTASTLVDD